MSRQGCLAFAERIRMDDALAREVAERGRDRAALLAIARAHGFAVDAEDLDELAADYARATRCRGGSIPIDTSSAAGTPVRPSPARARDRQ